MMENGDSARFLVRRACGPETLTWKAQNVLLVTLDKVKRVDSTAARSWALKKIPSSLRESLLHQILKFSNDSNAILKLWAILYSCQLYFVHLPLDLHEKCGATLMHHLNVGLETVKHSLPTLIFKASGLTAELEAEMKFLQKAHYLTIFTHRRGSTDEILQVLGQNCPYLQEVNISGSNKVTDQGIANFLGFKSFDMEATNHCCQTLKFIKMRSTGVRVFGVRILFHCCKVLEGVRCSSYDVLQGLVTQLKSLKAENKHGCMALKYLDFSNCFSILSKYLVFLTNLIEIRVGSDAPPQMRQTTKRLLIDNSNMVDDANVIAAIEEIPKLPNLKTLVLKAFDVQAIEPLLQTCVGSKLVRLDLHYNYHEPGINLFQLGNLCQNLQELSVSDSLIKAAGVKLNPRAFGHLCSLKLLRVSYSQVDDWEKIPRLAYNLKIIHMESSRGMSDSAVQSILMDNPLRHLEEFLVTGTNNRLSSKTVVRLTSSCVNLRWIGDLRDWNINSRERQTILPKLLHGEGWDLSRNEPKDQQQSLGNLMFEDLQSLTLAHSFDILTSK